MLRAYGPQSIRRLFILFSLIAILAASLIYFFIMPPQASQETTAQTRTGQLRLIDKDNREYFYLRTSTNGKISDIIVTGVTGEANLQLAKFVGKGELTVTGQTQAPARTNRRPGFGVRVDFYVASLTPPTSAAINCEKSGSKLDVLFLVDASGTMNDSTSTRFSQKDASDRPDKLVTAFADAAKSKLRSNDDRLGLVTFSNSTYKSDFSTNLDQTVTATKNIRYGLSGVDSNVVQGIETAEKQLAAARTSARDVPAVVIILADNQSEVASRAATLAQDDFKNRNIRYFTVSLGGGKDGLKQIADSGGGKYSILDDSDKLTETVNSIFTEIDKPFSQCISIELQSTKNTVRKGGKVVLTYKIINNSREEIQSVKIVQSLPTNIFQSEFDTAKITRLSDVTVGNMKPGESRTQEVRVTVAK
jgi:hypothetical protein